MIKMAFTPPSSADMERVASSLRERMRTAVIDRLAAIGAESVEMARGLPDKGGTYRNRTYRLHDSIGYMVT